MNKESKPIISVNGLVAKYGEKTVLDGISVDILPGEVTR